jgi:hypothetical protein
MAARSFFGVHSPVLSRSGFRFLELGLQKLSHIAFQVTNICTPASEAVLRLKPVPKVRNRANRQARAIAEPISWCRSRHHLASLHTRSEILPRPFHCPAARSSTVRDTRNSVLLPGVGSCISSIPQLNALPISSRGRANLITRSAKQSRHSLPTVSARACVADRLSACAMTTASPYPAHKIPCKLSVRESAGSIAPPEGPKPRTIAVPGSLPFREKRVATWKATEF